MAAVVTVAAVAVVTVAAAAAVAILFLAAAVLVSMVVLGCIETLHHPLLEEDHRFQV